MENQRVSCVTLCIQSDMYWEHSVGQVNLNKFDGGDCGCREGEGMRKVVVHQTLRYIHLDMRNDGKEKGGMRWLDMERGSLLRQGDERETVG